MKKTYKITLILTLCLVLSLSLLSGCAKEKEFPIDLSDTVWNYTGDYYVFNADGTIKTYNADGIEYEDYAGGYAIEDGVCKMVYGSANYTVTYEEEKLVATSEDNMTFRFDRAEAVPTPTEEALAEAEAKAAGAVSGVDVTSEDPNAIDLRDSTWETEGITYHFFADGTLEASNGSANKLGSYTWNGMKGTISLDGATVPLVNESGSIFIEGEDGYLYMLVSSSTFDY
ncbi:MAG: hypothetical protein E7464_02210 [Ruminococcaceae bacterium]|nr:hypothetical protein [Oscillospiraceae bacterium]